VDLISSIVRLIKRYLQHTDAGLSHTREKK